MHVNIEARDIISPFDATNIVATATCLKITIRYIIGEPTAKCHFQFKDDEETPVPYGEGNLELNIADWGADDSIMITRAAEVLGVTIIND